MITRVPVMRQSGELAQTITLHRIADTVTFLIGRNTPDHGGNFYCVFSLNSVCFAVLWPNPHIVWFGRRVPSHKNYDWNMVP